jgi:hypothetical protein
VYIGTSALFTFRILKILKSHISISLKKYGIKYIDRYIFEERTQKVPLKNTLYFGKYKKDKSLIVNNSKIVLT